LRTYYRANSLTIFLAHQLAKFKRKRLEGMIDLLDKIIVKFEAIHKIEAAVDRCQGDNAHVRHAIMRRLSVRGRTVHRLNSIFA
jgi:hypothetical protein